MTITAKIIRDSGTIVGTRLTTMELRYPRFIHAEFMTHRQFSRNASSSRAIPVERLIQDVIDDPAMPIHWGKNQPGMQAKPESEPVTRLFVDGGYCEPGYTVDFVCQDEWLAVRDNAIAAARSFSKAGYHKQLVNRLLEPFCHINVVVTATEWDNFFTLRLHPDAQPEIHELARVMKEAMDASVPRHIAFGEWHLPYILPEEESLDRDTKVAISAARCARVSYKTHDGAKPSISADTALANRLLVEKHMSPFEHQATPSVSDFANFKRWRSFRNILETKH